MNLLKRLVERVMKRGPSEPGSGLSYENARELARHQDPAVRRTLAARPDLRPEILYYLAGDPHPDVRREIAGNAATPPQANLKLAKDSDPDVRGDLAQKIARLAPGLSSAEQDRLRQLTYETLEILARDQITRVRQILAETLKDVAHAPPEVIRRLAHDSELVVAGPVLECSPVLTDDDLLEIIRSCPATGTLSAICRRNPVYMGISDAVAESGDADAIAVLLANDSAQIREETLDKLLDQAAEYENWHGPLVRRPHLSPRAITRLAQIVAESLLHTLLERPELDETTKAAVGAEVRRRIEASGGGMVDFHRGQNGSATETHEASETPIERALKLKHAGRLDEQGVLAALIDNDLDLVEAALEVMADVPGTLVSRIVAARSAKGIMALAWQAGLTASTAAQLQTALARIPPGDVLTPRADGISYPLSDEEMTWQIGFFHGMSSDDHRPPVERLR